MYVQTCSLTRFEYQLINFHLCQPQVPQVGGQFTMTGDGHPAVHN